MSDAAQAQTFPRGALLAAGALVCFSLLAAAAGSLFDTARTASVPEPEVAVRRSLHFEDTASGSVRVIDASAGQLVATLEPGTNGFVRGLMRALARTRTLHGAGAELPFILAYTVDGKLILEDPATSSRIDLNAFGPTNAGAFAALLNRPRG